MVKTRYNKKNGKNNRKNKNKKTRRFKGGGDMDNNKPKPFFDIPNFGNFLPKFTFPTFTLPTMPFFGKSEKNKCDVCETVECKTHLEKKKETPPPASAPEAPPTSPAPEAPPTSPAPPVPPAPQVPQPATTGGKKKNKKNKKNKKTRKRN